MQAGPVRTNLVACAAFFAALLLAPVASAQTATGTLRGQVTDPSGAAVPQATVAMTPSTGETITIKTTATGTYEIKGLAPGVYVLTVNASGFTVFESDSVQISAGQIQRVDARLVLAAQQQKIDVSGEAVHVDVSPENNAGAVVIQGKDLEALSDDPDELQNELQALAGPSAGPNGGQMYIDGFTAGQLPPKSSIREIRINQNPFSSEWDQPGFGRIEIFTKPGTGTPHGQFFVIGNDSGLNTLDPFIIPGVTPTPPYHTVQFSGNLSGPITKKISYFFEVEQRNIDNTSVVNAETLDSEFNPVQYTASVVNPLTRTTISPRFDFQLGANDTLTARYQFTRSVNNDSGAGGLSLQSLESNSSDIENTIQLDETHVISSRALTETRIQYLHQSNNQTAQSLLPSLLVIGEFNGGGNSAGVATDDEDHYELQSYTQIAFSKHSLRFGGRLRDFQVTSVSTSGFNGSYTFPSLAQLQAIETDCTNPISSTGLCDNPSFTTGTGIGPNRFSITTNPTGIPPTVKVDLVDVGVYAEDDWKLRPTVTLSYGLRLESQNHIRDHADWAPRVTLSWGLGHSKAGPTTVVRAGFGIFYDRFTDDLVLQVERQNGSAETQYVVPDPSFFFPNGATPASDYTGSASTSIYQIAPNLRAPYKLQSAFSVERQLGKSATITANYLTTHGEHQLLTNVIPETCGSSDTACNIYQYQSEGEFEQNQLIVNTNYRFGTKLTLFGFYSLSYAKSDTGGANSFPSNPYDILADYGRALFDTRHRVFLGGTVTLPMGFRLNPLIVAASGSPFNITTSQPLLDTTVFNQRPGLVSKTTCATVTQVPNPNHPTETNLDYYCTPFGTLDPLSTPGEALVPINYGSGPVLFTFNLRVSKTFGFGGALESAVNNGQQGGPGGGPGRGPGGGPGGPGGPGGGPGGPGGGGRGPGGGGLGGGGGPFGGAPSSGRKYTLTLSANIRNLFNVANFGPPVGNIGSTRVVNGSPIPDFDQSIGMAGGGGFGGGGGGGLYSFGTADRRIDLQLTFSF
jgi:hypothetical protein